MTGNDKQARLYEYRIKYNAGLNHAAFDSYHYYMAETPEQAFDYHLEAMRRHHRSCQNLQVEELNPWIEGRWEDKSEQVKLKDSNG